jgi:hypothetical protein
MERLWHSDVIQRAGVVGGVTLLLVLLAVGSMVISKSASSSAVATVRRAVAIGCERNQVQRVYDIVDERAGMHADSKIGIERPQIAEYYFRIVNCRKTYGPSNPSGLAVYLDAYSSKCFIGLVTGHYWKPEQQPTTDPLALHRICVAHPPN